MMEERSQSEDKKLYHERQVKELCALHALNNLFQTKQAFTKKELDEICNRLSPGSFINPHRSILGVGNYDVNVLMAALQEKGYETIWFDKRKDVDVLITENVMGFILNTPTDYKLGFMKLPIHRKHWIAIKCLQGQYMNLDSKLDAPSPIGDESSLLEYLRSELSNGEKELLLVVEPDVYENSLWRRDTKKSDSTNSPSSPDKMSDKLTEIAVSPDIEAHNTNGDIDHRDSSSKDDTDEEIDNSGNQHVPPHLKSESLVIEEMSNTIVESKEVT